MNASDNIINLVKDSEGCKLTSYQDSVGIWTIGYGSIYMPNGARVKIGDTITQDEAESLLLHSIQEKQNQILSKDKNNSPLYLHVELNQNQFDALTDFVYNLGIGTLSTSTLLKVINNDPNDKEVGVQFMRWVHGDGVVLPGLVTRREKEVQLYFTPITQTV